MTGTSDPTRRHGELTRIGLGVSDELGNRLGRNRWVYQHDVGVDNNAGDRGGIANEIKIQLVVQRRVDRVVAPCYKQRIAVRRCAHDRLSADIGAATWPVLDDEWLAEALRQPLSHQASDGVDPAGRGEWHDQMHRPRRIGLRPRNTP
jgi:hypothetical protein